MTVLVQVRTDREAASAASPRSEPETLPEAYARLGKDCGGCPIEAGLIGSLVDNECRHGRLPRDTTPPCGCWPSEVVKDPPLVLAESPLLLTAGAEPPLLLEPGPSRRSRSPRAKVATQVSTLEASQLVEIPPFIEAVIEQIDAELDRLRAERAAVLALKEAIR
jgi:hypothetical protein